MKITALITIFLIASAPSLPGKIQHDQLAKKNPPPPTESAITIQLISEDELSDEFIKQFEADLAQIEKPQAITKSSTLEDFKGRPSVILIGTTYCPHCRNSMPDYKTKIWDQYKNKVNLWVHVIDGENGTKFETNDIAQGYNNNLDYADITGEDCTYVPSWVVLDTEGNVTAKKCGGGDMDEIETALKELIE